MLSGQDILFNSRKSRYHPGKLKISFFPAGGGHGSIWIPRLVRGDPGCIDLSASYLSELSLLLLWYGFVILILGIIIPATILLISFIVTWVRYRHFFRQK
jgi:hypothetical protein